MAEVLLEERVTRLEDGAAEVWRIIAETERQMAQSRAETDRRIAENDWRIAQSRVETDRLIAQSRAETDRLMAQSRAETDQLMAQSKAETDRQIAESRAETDRLMAQSKAETDRQIAESAKRIERTLDQLSQEMQEYKEENRVIIARLDASAAAMQKKWGELSNRLGTLAEDFVSPSVPRILGTIVQGLEATDSPPPIDMAAVRVSRRHPKDRGRTREYDVVAICGDYVLINETKSRLNPEDIQDFIRVMSEARDFFPEYMGHHFIGAIASLRVDESLVRYGQRHGLIVLGLRGDIMEILNAPGFKPTLF
jgi:cytochrome c556